MNDDIGAELKAAILNLHEAMMFGFERVDVRLAEHDRKFEELRHDMNRRFDRLLNDMDGRFALVDSRFDRMDERFDRMDERFDRMDVRFDRLDERVIALEPDGQRPAL